MNCHPEQVTAPTKSCQTQSILSSFFSRGYTTITTPSFTSRGNRWLGLMVLKCLALILIWTLKQKLQSSMPVFYEVRGFVAHLTIARMSLSFSSAEPLIVMNRWLSLNEECVLFNLCEGLTRTCKKQPFHSQVQKLHSRPTSLKRNVLVR